MSSPSGSNYGLYFGVNEITAFASVNLGTPARTAATSEVLSEVQRSPPFQAVQNSPIGWQTPVRSL